jgi:hypothetical protein
MKGHVKKLDLLFDRVMESHVKMVGKKSALSQKQKVSPLLNYLSLTRRRD